jgi:hypothetical protein
MATYTFSLFGKPSHPFREGLSREGKCTTSLGWWKTLWNNKTIDKSTQKPEEPEFLM